jgi:proline iminopeptidase
MISISPGRAGLLVLLAVALVPLASCYNLDVRLGVGDGEGVRLAYRMVGSGKTLVVINDGPGYDKAIMYRGFDPLAADLRVVYYDQRGCGKSEPLSPVIPSRIRDNVEDLEALRRYLHLGRISIAAHGWGAVIALEYARRYGEFVDSIVLITPISPFSPEPDMENILDRLPRDAKAEVAELLNHPGISMLERRERIMRLVVPVLFYNKRAAEDLDLEDLRFSPDVNIRLGEELKSLDLYPVLRDVDAPTLVIAGAHDVSIPVRDQIAYTDGIRSASAVVFNGSGHFPFYEERSYFLNIVRQFLLHDRVPALVRAPSPGSGLAF